MSVHVVQDTKLQGLVALSQRLRKLNKRILVGVPAGKAEEDGTSMALIAAVNEFGGTIAPHSTLKKNAETGRLEKRATFEKEIVIPERSFLRAGLRHGFYAITRLNVNSLRAVAEGTMTADVALARTGAVAAGEVQKYIPVGEFKENAPSTIAKKGSDKPLIASGSLRQSITYVVEDGAL